MANYDVSQNEYFQQLRGMVSDMLEKRSVLGIVIAIHGESVDVRAATGGTIIKNVPISGGVTNLQIGDTIYLNYYGSQPVGIGSRSVKAGSSAGVGPHTHNDLVSDSELAAGLALKADREHTHSFKTLYAEAGYIGGWSIDTTGIYQDRVRLSAIGYLGFGPTGPVDTWGSTVGGWIGFDYQTTHVDAEGLNTAAGAKLSLYYDVDNYIQWTGRKLLIKAQNFKLDGDGKVTALSGDIAGWKINPNSLDSPGGNLKLSSAGYLSGNFSQGTRGWKIGEDGNAEFNNILVRGELHATSFVMDEINAVGGQLLVRQAGTLYESVTTV